MADGALRLTPEQALAYFHELSVDLRAGAVLGAQDGALHAGPEGLAEPARALLGAAGDARLVDLEAGGARVIAVRGTGYALVLVLGPRALPGLARFDAERVLADLEGADGPDSAPPAPAPERVQRAVFAAATALAGAAMG